MAIKPFPSCCENLENVMDVIVEKPFLPPGSCSRLSSSKLKLEFEEEMHGGKELQEVWTR
jgi:hypothetical protein